MRFESAAIGVFALLGCAQACAAAAEQPASVDEVIVTGTRVSGLRAADSAAPIQILDAAALNRSGAPDLLQTLSNSIPSFQAQAVGGDTANETLSARLRGLSPNHTLVLINGKRRHGTANLAILSSAFQGGAAADLNMIPASSIRRIEVLQDGAAAQYGSDAIAGVINIILKSDDDGGSLAASGGAYFDEGGATGDVQGNVGLKPSQGGFLNLSAESRYHDYSTRGGPDQRLVQAVSSGAHPDWANLADYPNVNRIFGDARYQLNLVSFNAGQHLGDGVELYAVGTYGHKYAAGWANFRTPNRLPTLHPQGFNPLDTTKEQDLAVTGGVRGESAGWRWDLSSTWGRDAIAVNITNSANIDLFNDSGATPSDFHAGDFSARQWTTNLDLSRTFEVGLAGPLNVAFGAERRSEAYEIKAGDAPSRYKAGSQSYPGFSLTDAGRHGRDNTAVYGDLSVAPVTNLTLDLAARFEHFSDFGDTTVAKLTGRWDLSPGFALRGTVSTGFRAPTLAEEYYSATNVQPNSAFVQLPPNAAAAKLIGIDPLKPEKSSNLSLGLVAHPLAGVSLSLDAYQVEVRDRVVGSGTLYGFYGGAVRSAAVNAAIVANGNVLEPVPFSGVNVFTNGVDTRTRGAELVVNWASDLHGAGRIDWTLAGNWNETEVTRVRATPAVLAASGQSLFDRVATSTLETASPKYRLVLDGQWRRGAWGVNVRESLYGNASRWSDPGDGNLYLDQSGAKAITDLELSYRLTRDLTASVGADNLFNVYPDRVNAQGLAASGAAGNPAVEIYPAFSPIGINGGWWYGKLRWSF